ncbi:hypothetical protein GUITHDRAFT_166257 [Guillardia theta CCMP2712]|uniref:Uncharacterized protein n=2 Tax=Guillardia theta TaxID=55529 RepID=L1IEF4_GUITC|nr:hypothetical protein GUITHDRAFT_166257 [Guillardia theta CCMP2712]EKX34264.1 hypothetical protein GUITHDRAFT_166257 [Guillardia theta CCMP2712]|eukprot:XP_005821244.1 hypothetical protein GUITHDRAFT_166257 [Guillardia theta CCMP2712]
MAVQALISCQASFLTHHLRLRGQHGVVAGGPRLLRMSGGKQMRGKSSGPKVLDEYHHEFQSKHEEEKSMVRVSAVLEGDQVKCSIECKCRGEMVLHWAFSESSKGWYAVPDECLPAGSRRIDEKASQTTFVNGRIEIVMKKQDMPEAISFVLKKSSPEEWISGPGGDFKIALKSPDSSSIGQLIMEREAKASHWSILDRMRLVNQNVKAVAESEEGLSWLYTLLRFNQMKLVPLTRNSNYQSKDLAHTQDGVSLAFASLYAKQPDARLWARMCVALVPRGGGNGDAIRLEILDIMRRHGIKEGHRPGIEDRFLEEWHQKLHTNCAPDDIIIAEAYIRFLETGNPDDYWSHLKGNGLSWEYMSSIGGGKGSANSGLKGLTATPLHLPQLCNDIKHLRWTLMQVHGGADLDFMIHKASGGLDGELNGILREIQSNRHEWWVPGKILEARRRLKHLLSNGEGHRDGLMLDVSLDQWFKVQLEKTQFGHLEKNNLLDVTSVALENCALSLGQELEFCHSQLCKVKEMGNRWSKEWGLVAKATVERISLALQEVSGRIYSCVQPKAEQLGKAMGTEEAYLTNFGEEVIRGSSTFIVSQLLACLDPMIRECANIGTWEPMSSIVEATGSVQVLENLVAIQGKEFKEKQVVVVREVRGIEDIPKGVTAILTRSSIDALSHIAIRARNQRVLFATCHDEQAFSDLCRRQGLVDVSVDSMGNIVVKEGVKSDQKVQEEATGSIKVVSPASPKADVLEEEEFDEQVVGSKSLNLHKLIALKRELPAYVEFPFSAAIPFGVFEKILAADANKPVQQKIQKLQASLTGEPQHDLEVLKELRNSFEEVEIPASLLKDLQARTLKSPLSNFLQEYEEESCEAIRRVWASKWSDRAYFSRKAHRIPDSNLFMGVLLQPVAAASYAFVLHTKNPMNGKEEELAGELVLGLGEALVGNHPGRALSFLVDKKSGKVTVGRLPSKREGFFLEDSTFIFRSDSNCEDLDKYAGAGLYDSVMAIEPEKKAIDYSNDRVFWDGNYREELLKKIAEVGIAIERQLGKEQDIEGVVSEDKIVIVQSRNQV